MLGFDSCSNHLVSEEDNFFASVHECIIRADELKRAKQKCVT